MSEKRFRVRFEQEDGRGEIVNEKGVELTAREVVELLNEQQATITHLEKVNGKNFAKRRLLEQDNLVLRNENEQLRQSYKYADELIEEIREIFQKNGVESGYNKVILESLFFSTRENEGLLKEKDYWKKQAMTLLMQVRRLTPRMTDEEVKEFSKELEDGEGV